MPAHGGLIQTVGNQPELRSQLIEFDHTQARDSDIMLLRRGETCEKEIQNFLQQKCLHVL
jgi:hypothetical protein